MNSELSECHQFDTLRTSLRHDLVSCHGFSNPDAGAILNWFDPSRPEYLERVDNWVINLCQGASYDAPLPQHLTHINSFGSYDLCNLPTHQIGAIHQVCKLFYKYHGDPRRETNMSEVKDRLSRPLPITLDSEEIAGIRECLSGILPADPSEMIGRFGPGATAEGFSNSDKWNRIGLCPNVPPSLYRVNPRDTWTPSGYSAHRCTKIAEVPKTIKSNRVVSSEPAMSMFAELAVADSINYQIHSIFRQHVSLQDAERHNRYLYREDATTLDLSDASDHISTELVALLLPQLWPVLASVRSTHALFPDGDEVLLRTFAPMGSGLCFVVMTTIILGIIAFIQRAYRELYTPWYSVYGDDIIVPRAIFDTTVDLLHRSGLVVNTKKSCGSGIFKESCGLELYRGVNITPAYIRDPIPSLPASKVEQVCSRLEAGSFPDTARQIAKDADCAKFLRYNRNLQRQEVCVRTLSATKKARPLEGWAGLNRWFCLRTQGNTWDSRQPSGVVDKVWTRTAWRLNASEDYPFLTHELVTRVNHKEPDDTTVVK